MITEPDYSAIDRAVEKVIAKHECMFRIEMIAREKIDADLPFAMLHCSILSKLSRLSAEQAKLRVIHLSGNNLTQKAKLV